jgi:hypothetical protein
MRIRRILAAGLFLTLASAGCARSTDNDNSGVASAQTGKPTPSSSSSAAAVDDQQAALEFAKCMREHGLAWFPDPQPGGRLNIKSPKGADPAKMQAAQEACKKFIPNGGAPSKMSPEELAEAREMAKCMRAHGLPDFPDPEPDGGLRIDSRKLGSGPGDPTFDKAQEACAKFGPKPHTETRDPDGAATQGHPA